MLMILLSAWYYFRDACSAGQCVESVPCSSEHAFGALPASLPDTSQRAARPPFVAPRAQLQSLPVRVTIKVGFRMECAVLRSARKRCVRSAVTMQGGVVRVWWLGTLDRVGGGSVRFELDAFCVLWLARARSRAFEGRRRAPTWRAKTWTKNSGGRRRCLKTASFAQFWLFVELVPQFFSL